MMSLEKKHRLIGILATLFVLSLLVVAWFESHH